MNMNTNKLKLSWTGDYESLKEFVSEYLGLNGVWSSPGGEKKTFTDNGSISISWLKNKKVLSCTGLDSIISSKLVALVCYDKDSDKIEVDPSTTTITRTDEAFTNEASLSECQCHNLATEIEGIKLDGVIAEAKLESQLSGMVNLVNKNQQEIAGIQNENAEFKCQIDRINNSIMNTTRRREVETNDIMIDYIEILKSSLVEWKARACKAEMRYESLANTFNKLENTNESQHEVDEAPICITTINDCVGDKGSIQPQPNQQTKELTTERVNEANDRIVLDELVIPIDNNSNNKDSCNYDGVQVNQSQLIDDLNVDPILITDESASNLSDKLENCSEVIIACSVPDNNHIAKQPITKGLHVTYAKVVASHPALNKCKHTTKPKANSKSGYSPQNPQPKTNESSIDSEGFTGVERKRNKIKKFFVTGIAENVKESQILSYLQRQNITPTYISIFSSKRRGTLSAKIHVPSAVSKLVQEDNFWPKFVICRPWRSRENIKNTVERKINLTHDGNYSTYV